MADLHESLTEFIPIAEKAVRANGTARIKVIGEGWGSSGYYGRDVLQRDIPRVFPNGTHMYWNHATPTEEMERPEGDLNHLAATTFGTPVWEDQGPNGPGMYVDILPRSTYANDIDELAEHIGVSIRGDGRVTHGEAEGKEGRIVKEIGRGKSIDFVTRPGAGGAIVSLFEAAGRGPEADPAGADESLQEAANIGEWLESRLHLTLTRIADDFFGDGYITREERIALSRAIGQALDAYHQSINENAPQLYQRRPYQELPAETGNAPVSESEQEQSMSESENTDLQEAQGRISTLEQQLQEANAVLARQNERLILRDARDFVQSRLNESGLTDLTQRRLLTTLVSNPPLTDAGVLDEAKFGESVKDAIEEAKAEFAAILQATTGQISGFGESQSAETPKPEAIEANMAAAMQILGLSESEAKYAINGRNS